MGDLKKKNKFEDTINELNKLEKENIDKTSQVIDKIVGKKEKKKALPTYIPMSLYQEFDQINKAYGLSNNAAINMLIREYVTNKKDILNNI